MDAAPYKKHQNGLNHMNFKVHFDNKSRLDGF
jgi:hypothetical protein